MGSCCNLPCFLPYLIQFFITFINMFSFLEGPTYLILEYASHGSLKQFLQSCLPDSFDHAHHHSSGSSSGYSSGGSSFISSRAPLSAQNSIISRPPLSAQNSVISRPPLSAQTSIFSNTSFTFSAYSTRGSNSPTRTNTTCSSPCADNSPQHECTCQELEDEREEVFVAVADALEPTPAHKLLPLNHDYINTPQPLLLDDVQNFALQIASGLEHLKKMKVCCPPFSHLNNCIFCLRLFTVI